MSFSADFFACVASGNVHDAERLLLAIDQPFESDFEYRATLLNFVSSETKETPLHVALRSRNLEMTSMLIHYGANPFARDGNGVLAIDAAREISNEFADEIVELMNQHHSKVELSSFAQHEEISHIYGDLSLPDRRFIPEGSTLLQVFWDNVHDPVWSMKPAFRDKRAGEWKTWTWKDYGEQVKEAALAMQNLGFSYSRDPFDKPKISVLSRNSPEFLIVEMAAMSIGGVTLGIYTSDMADAVQYVVENSDSRILFVDGAKQLEKAMTFINDLPNLRVVVFYPEADQPLPNHDRVMSYTDFMLLGQGDGQSIEQLARSIDPSDFCMMVYTSGTTGNPKGVMYSHENIAFECEQISKCAADWGMGNGMTSLSFLPLCHIAERLQGQLLAIVFKTCAYFCSDIRKVLEYLQELQPSILLCVPRLWEKIYNEMNKKFSQATGLKRYLIDSTLDIGAKVRDLRNRNMPVPAWLGFKWGVLRALVVKKIKQQLGLTNVTLLASGAAPLPKEHSEFFGALEMDIVEVYGQTECTGVCSFNPPFGLRSGTVGVPLPGVQIRLGYKQEILVRGPCVMLGYYRDEEKTRETIDEDGWLHTGDVGQWTSEGYLKITDRLKEFLKTAGGKMVAPSIIEARFKAFPIISAAVVVGDKKKYLTCILTLDESLKVDTDGKERKVNLIDWLRNDAGIRDIDPDRVSMQDYRDHPQVVSKIAEYVRLVNDGGHPMIRTALPSYEQLKGFHVLPRELSIEAGEVTPSLKIKRRRVAAIYDKEVDMMIDRADRDFARSSE